MPERHTPYEPGPEPEYTDEHEYPDPTLAHQSARVAAGALIGGIIASQAELCPATWFIWSFLAVHLAGVVFLTDYAGETGLVALCATFGLHSGVALSELALWTLGRDGEDSVGPWSLVVIFASVLYLHSFWTECMTLPPDYITSISLFFPMFPAFNAALALSCVELFLEWRYFPENKVWGIAVFIGGVLMACGQALIASACRTAERNFWASCRNMPEEEERPEDFVGLEVPDRRIVQERAYKWERHPAYLGAMIWGVGSQVALCNPVMLILVSFVLWASLLYVALEEEQQLYDEFKAPYANYSALTNCWIPLFNTFLENAAFQREMSDNAEECADDDLDEEEVDDECDEDELDDDCPSEDDMLPTWEGVPKGGALWNRQFREPWLLG
uniref:Protein-S-isoprenylcysteine O-methyltransferase n=1 Tax=Zooxanthella nutricula TaxID=1333877 RepID=A0A7S2VMF5_9DINO